MSWNLLKMLIRLLVVWSVEKYSSMRKFSRVFVISCSMSVLRNGFVLRFLYLGEMVVLIVRERLIVSVVFILVGMVLYEKGGVIMMNVVMWIVVSMVVFSYVKLMGMYMGLFV